MEILKDRAGSYGRFATNALISQRLKMVMHLSPKWNSLAPDQKEALYQITSKISRLLTGDTTHVDSWDDIAGYSLLVSRRIVEDGVQELGEHALGYYGA